MSELRTLFNKYGCDKSKKHNYHEVYEPEFSSIRNDNINILEIGVFKGDSIRAWLEFFPNATIYGLDIFHRVKAEEIDVMQHERVKWLKCDSTSYDVGNQIENAWPGIRFDIIIDDGLHTPAANARTLHNLFPLLEKNGRFYVEDVWPLDTMNHAEMQHHWITSHPNDYNLLEMNKFTQEILDKNPFPFDLRKTTGEPDSYIIRVQGE